MSIVVPSLVLCVLRQRRIGTASPRVISNWNSFAGGDVENCPMKQLVQQCIIVFIDS